MHLKRGNAGFTLVETLAAFTILAMSMVVLSSGLATAFRREAGSRTREDLLRLAKNEIDSYDMQRQLEVGVSHKTAPEGYESVVTVEPYAPAQAAYLPQAFWIDVAIARTPGGPQVHLRTLKLRKGSTG